MVPVLTSVPPSTDQAAYRPLMRASEIEISKTRQRYPAMSTPAGPMRIKKLEVGALALFQRDSAIESGFGDEIFVPLPFDHRFQASDLIRAFDAGTGLDDRSFREVIVLV